MGAGSDPKGDPEGFHSQLTNDIPSIIIRIVGIITLTNISKGKQNVYQGSDLQ